MAIAMRPTIIAFASPKGGVGKSTSCACLRCSNGEGLPRSRARPRPDRTLKQWFNCFPDLVGILTVEGLGEVSLWTG